MGKYFQFVNLTRKTESALALPFNFGLPWAKNLDRIETVDLRQQFQFVAEANHWALDEQVIAIGEDGTVIFSPIACASSTPDPTLSHIHVKEESAPYEVGSSMTFSDYYKLNAPAHEVAQRLHVGYIRQRLGLPQSHDTLDGLDQLSQRLYQNLTRIGMHNETARREFLIAPILSQLLDYVDAKMMIEYPLYIDTQLQGILDYYLETRERVLVIEAKNGDLQRGFHQLMAELVAVDQHQKQEKSTEVLPQILYGVVTVGDIWQFGQLNRSTMTITQDIDLYTVPAQIETLMATLVALLKGN